MTPPITAPARADSAEIKLAFIVSDCPKNNNERGAVPCLQD